MYLAMTVRTLANTEHSSKIIVPQGTTAQEDLVSHENDLSALQFNGIKPSHYFDRETRNIYMKITSEEHEAGYKE